MYITNRYFINRSFLNLQEINIYNTNIKRGNEVTFRKYYKINFKLGDMQYLFKLA